MNCHILYKFYETVIAVLLGVIKQTASPIKQLAHSKQFHHATSKIQLTVWEIKLNHFVKEITIKHSILRITFDAFNEWTIFQPEPVCYIRSCPKIHRFDCFLNLANPYVFPWPSIIDDWYNSHNGLLSRICKTYTT